MTWSSTNVSMDAFRISSCSAALWLAIYDPHLKTEHTLCPSLSLSPHQSLIRLASRPANSCVFIKASRPSNIFCSSRGRKQQQFNNLSTMDHNRGMTSFCWAVLYAELGVVLLDEHQHGAHVSRHIFGAPLQFSQTTRARRRPCKWRENTNDKGTCLS